jgi:hypothetical protein
MKPTEALAKRINEGIEAGARMIYREDQSVRTHDFDLRRTTNPLAVVEVTSITDGIVESHVCGDRPVPVDSENALRKGLAHSHGNRRHHQAHRRQCRRLPRAYRT